MALFDSKKLSAMIARAKHLLSASEGPLSFPWPAPKTEAADTSSWAAKRHCTLGAACFSKIQAGAVDRASSQRARLPLVCLRQGGCWLPCGVEALQPRESDSSLWVGPGNLHFQQPPASPPGLFNTSDREMPIFRLIRQLICWTQIANAMSWCS